MRGEHLAIIIVLVVAGLLAAVAADAQAPGKVVRIGYMVSAVDGAPRLREAFRQGLRDLGYVEGRNFMLEIKSAEGKHERYATLAAELVALKVDVIVTSGFTPAALAAKQATRTIPIVFIGVGDPVTSGLVTSLAQPGGNVTGLSVVAPELISKRIELLTQTVPGVSRIAVLWQPGALEDRTQRDLLQRAEVAARTLGIRLQFVEARDVKDLDRAFSDMTRARARTAVRNLVRSGVDPTTARSITGHRTPAVFERYNIIDENDVRQAMQRRAAYENNLPATRQNARRESGG